MRVYLKLVSKCNMNIRGQNFLAKNLFSNRNLTKSETQPFVSFTQLKKYRKKI